ncbi:MULTISPECIES: Fe(3+) ABC transporter substrate-binding protein [unclassified Fusibacter]|uniref:Fe(3+) ABC transporter substrate-binding protein n=1 Tax=unclassified Fusibacter TaxID=2624464 RepID=UPI0010137BC0|nr:MULTISPECIES: Fe(3+) ABC transporter substrate-binding protein [unclassified Fusibacter]MCK8059197.1 Fe(3+) ABC transporter substrate-binding protein [Fusibacter sp. A2]NPE22608.1 Fe(3+) ABC transporter substrate-binding protein [Fusibacter sp. A1]RXV60708.1 iron ABC transporter substrate-binding protein [Fusibacter sp. A1]
MKKIVLIISVVMMFALVMTGCAQPVEETEVKEVEVKDAAASTVVNLYTDRHYDTDQALFDLFTEKSGITVNVVKAGSDELIERLTREGADTEADVLMTADAGRLHRAKALDLLQPVTSEVLEANVPANLKDAENFWTALTIRARVLVYSLDRVSPSELSTYEDLGSEKWNGKVLVRSSSNIYNQSLLASLIAVEGEEKAEQVVTVILNNMARTPQGNDRDQAKAVVAGEGDVAIMNTYYIGKMINSEDPAEVEVASKVGVFFPDQETNGTHINISGAGITKYAKHSDAALLLIEFLSSDEAQESFAQANYEYPVNPNVEASDLLKSWGDFKAQDINLSLLGEYNNKAVEIFNRIGWE